MLKYKPFLIFTVIASVCLCTILVSFIAEDIINTNYDSFKSTLATVEITDGKAFAVYEYKENTYRYEIRYSTALKSGMTIPVYFPPDSPSNAEIKDVTAVLIMRYAPLTVFFPAVVGMVITAFKYKAKRTPEYA